MNKWIWLAKSSNLVGEIFSDDNILCKYYSRFYELYYFITDQTGEKWNRILQIDLGG